MAEPRDRPELERSLSRLGAALSERRRDLIQTRDRIEQLQASLAEQPPRSLIPDDLEAAALALEERVSKLLLAPDPPPPDRGTDGHSDPPSPSQAARILELEQQLSLLTGELEEVRLDLERVAASTAWRVGHALTSGFMRVRGRRPKTRGAVATALARIEGLEQIHPGIDRHQTPSALSGDRGLESGDRPQLPTIADGAEAVEKRRALASEVRRRLGPVPTLKRFPSLSVIVASRGSAELQNRLVQGLAEFTDYPALELVIVEGPSSDSAVLDGLDAPFPVRVLSNEQETAVTDARNQGAAMSESELLLFLSEGVTPFESGWLKELVLPVLRSEVAAAGATVLYERPQDPGDDRWLVWQRAIRFGPAGRDIAALRSGEGRPLFDERFGAEQRCPAVTAACLLVERASFEQIGGFSPGDNDDLDGADLCLKLRASGGETVCTGRAVLSRADAPAVGVSDDGTGAALKRFHERWGPIVRRALRLDALSGEGLWAEHGPRLGIAAPSPHPDQAPALRWQEIGEALTELGWRVTHLRRGEDGWEPPPVDLDYLVSSAEDLDVRTAGPGVPVLGWIGDQPEHWMDQPWFERLDLILTSSTEAAKVVQQRTGRTPQVLALEQGLEQARSDRPDARVHGAGGRPTLDLREILTEHERRLSFCIKIAASTWEAAEGWGDLYFARGLEAELRRRGHPCRVQVQQEWEELEGLDCDVVIHLRGVSRYAPRPGQLNVLWSISHPDELSVQECDVFDLVCVASARFAERLRAHMRTDVCVLEQATDPRVFFPERDSRFEHELVFVGNSRNRLRRILRDILPTSHELAVYGKNWRGLIDPSLVMGDFVPNSELHKLYSSASIVLCDHWDDMREHGFVSNRIFDALACGALLISDHMPELGTLFGDAVLSYRTPDELRELVERMLANPAERAARGARGRELVLSEHTFAHRVETLLAQIDRVRSAALRPLAAAGAH